MDNPGIQLFVNVCLLLIGLVILQVFLKAWDRKEKAKKGIEAKPVIKAKKK